MSRPNVDFEKVLASEGVPLTAEGVTALLEADVMAAVLSTHGLLG